MAQAKEVGVDYVWFNRLLNETPVAENERRGRRPHGPAGGAARPRDLSAQRGQSLQARFTLTDLDLETMSDHQGFKKDFKHLVRSMQIASRIGVGSVGAFTFAWPGEYSSGKPTWAPCAGSPGAGSSPRWTWRSW